MLPFKAKMSAATDPRLVRCRDDHAFRVAGGSQAAAIEKRKKKMHYGILPMREGGTCKKRQCRTFAAMGLPREVALKKIIVLLIGMGVLVGCAARGYRSDFDFANKLIREGLWQEAHFRLQKARAAGNDSAALHNNLAVVLEGLERYDEAGGEYELALKKDPGNARIQSNVDRLKKNREKAVHEKK